MKQGILTGLVKATALQIVYRDFTIVKRNMYRWMTLFKEEESTGVKPQNGGPSNATKGIFKEEAVGKSIHTASV